jgi:hypothetical protein
MRKKFRLTLDGMAAQCSHRFVRIHLADTEELVRPQCGIIGPLQEVLLKVSRNFVEPRGNGSFKPKAR